MPQIERMRILLYSINFWPELTGIGKFNGELVDWLVRNDCEVRVVTSPPYYPEWAVHDGYFANRYVREDYKGARVYRSPIYVPRRVTGGSRVLHLASFALSSVASILASWRWKPNLVIVLEPAFLCAPAALLFARLRGARAWLHVQDFEVDAAFELGILPRGKMSRFVKRFERALMQRFDCVSTISASMAVRLRDKGVPALRTFLWPNWVDTDVILPLDRPSEYRQELGIESHQIVALYSGNIGRKQGIDLVLDVARRVAAKGNTRMRFVICGHGADYARLRAEAADISNIVWLPLQPYDRLNELLNVADIHLLPQRAAAGDLVMPSKLPTMLASGKPVLATADEGTEVAETVACCGLVVKPGDPESFEIGLLRLAADEEFRKKLGQVARSAALEKFSRDRILGSFLEKSRDLVSKKQ